MRYMQVEMELITIHTQSDNEIYKSDDKIFIIAFFCAIIDTLDYALE